MPGLGRDPGLLESGQRGRRHLERPPSGPGAEWAGSALGKQGWVNM